jgi:hypothetical protein
MGIISLDISTDDGILWTTLWSQTVNQGEQWISVSVDISAYTGGGTQLRFNRLTGGTWRADVAIDNISVTGSMSSAPVVPIEPITVSGNSATTINAFTLYPNPVRQGVLNVAYTQQIDSYKIFNMYGQVVLSGNFIESIDVSQLSSAAYIIELQSGLNKLKGYFIVE